ncbi:MAG: hypothetical protein L6Q37_17255, partial [Bdellovibrionaceae bacterium]|nr:hypothetical protein [Pseudobdellovibrionaceae bacterium]
ADEPSLFLDQNYHGVVNTVTTNNNLEIKLSKSSLVAKSLLENYLLAKEENDKTAEDVKSLLRVQGMKELKKLSVNFKRNDAWYSKIDPANWHKSSNISLDLSSTLAGLTDKSTLLDDEKKALCALFFNEIKDFENKSFFKSCVVDPSSYLKASLKETILTNPKIVGAPIASRHQALKYTATMEYTTSDVVNSGHSYGGSIDGSVAAGTSKNKPFNLSVPFVPVKFPALNISSTLNVGMNGKIYALNSFEKNQKGSEGVTSEVAEELSITSFGISFSAKVQKCLLITPVEDKISLYKDYFQYSNLEVPNGSFYCLNPENRDVVRTENYYLINKTVMKESNSFFDIYSSAINPIRFVVRGQKSFSMIKNLLAAQDGYKIKFIPFSNPFTKNLPQSKLIEDPSLYMSQDDYRFISVSNIDLLN